MELQHILGSTYAVETPGALLPLYRTAEHRALLVDTGTPADAEGLYALLQQSAIQLTGIFCSHAHYDHTGSAAFLRKRFGCPIFAPAFEAAVGATPESYRRHYPNTAGVGPQLLSQAAFPTDTALSPLRRSLTVDGAVFRLLPLPGHTAGQMGLITPDGVAYLADALLTSLSHVKLPTSMDVGQDLRTKEGLLELNCKAYILAHRGVVESLQDVVPANTALFRQKGEELLASLEGTMEEDVWRDAFCRRAGIHTTDPFKVSITHRNFGRFAAWLQEQGKVLRQDDGTYIRI